MMTKYLVTFIAFVSFSFSSFAQQNTNWDKWSWLLGQWQGEGSGKPGQGGGKFSFDLELNDKIIVRKSHSEYPTTDNKHKIIHEDLMVIYLNMAGSPTKAIYFDNEGHAINYSINYADKAIILLSDKAPNVPIFKLTYTLLDDNTINTKFEMSQDGEKFMTYIEGKSKKFK
jgi:hypothetical protein